MLGRGLLTPRISPGSCEVVPVLAKQSRFSRSSPGSREAVPVLAKQSRFSHGTRDTGPWQMTADPPCPAVSLSLTFHKLLVNLQLD